MISLAKTLTAVLLMTHVFLLISTQTIAAERTLDTVRERGYVRCGVGEHDFGFTLRNTQGEWHGFDVDFCRAIAAATLGDAQKVRFVPVDSQSRLPALINAEIDVLFRTTTWTLSRDAALPIHFTRITLYESQGVIGRQELKVTRLKDVKQGSVCVNAGTTSHHNLVDYLKQHNPALKVLVLETQEGRWNAFFSGRCDLMSSDQMDLQAGVMMLAPNAQAITFLSDVISKEPLSPAVRSGDDHWLDIVTWVINATVALEELGVSKALANQPNTPQHANLTRLVEMTARRSESIGLDKQWIRRIAGEVGNYGEIFDRNLGVKSRYKMARQLNRLWTQGGLMYALPFR